MAADNHTTIVGNLVDDPELRFTNNGIAVANLRVAVTQRIQQDGEWRDGDTSFLKVNVWRGQAEHLADSLTKGDRVMVTGRLRQRNWETPGGDAVGDRAEGRRRRRLAQGGSPPGRTQRPAGERRPHLGCPVPGLWRRISASTAWPSLPRTEPPRVDRNCAVPLVSWSRVAGFSCHGDGVLELYWVSMPRLLWRRCRLRTTSRYSTMSSVTINNAGDRQPAAAVHGPGRFRWGRHGQGPSAAVGRCSTTPGSRSRTSKCRWHSRCRRASRTM